MAKRMVLVDPKMLASLNQTIPPVTDPVSDVLKCLDIDMESVLNKRDVPLSTKLDQYNEVLKDYLAKAREYKGYSHSRDIVHSQPTQHAPTLTAAAADPPLEEEEEEKKD